MNLNYVIFKREKQAYNSNYDIKIELCQNNIELIPLESKYVKDIFNSTTKEDELFDYARVS